MTMTTDYQITPIGSVFRVIDSTPIANDPDSKDWQDYQQWLTDGGVPDPFVPADVPGPLMPSFPNEVTDRQFFQALAQIEQITQDEALAAVGTGTIPARMVEAIAALPEEQQFSARMLVTGNVVYLRNSPTVAMLQQNLGWTDQQTDDLWQLAASL